MAPPMDIEFLIKATERHGQESDADMEVGDLQFILRACWAHMDEGSRRAVWAEACDKLSDWLTEALESPLWVASLRWQTRYRVAWKDVFKGAPKRTTLRRASDLCVKHGVSAVLLDDAGRAVWKIDADGIYRPGALR